jgi:hypothetical protein
MKSIWKTVICVGLAAVALVIAYVVVGGMVGVISWAVILTIIWIATKKSVSNTEVPKAKPRPELSEAEPAAMQQETAKQILRNAALQAAKHALEIGTITKAQEAGITARMKASPTLRNLLDELIATLEANGETSQAEIVKEADAELFKGCTSEGQS